MKEPLRRLRYNVAVSLDGFIAPLDGTTDWIVHDDSIDLDALDAQFDTFVMGRKTYECLSDMGELNPLRNHPPQNLVVVSKTLKGEQHPGVTVVSRDFVDRIADLKNAEGRDIWLMGGGQLAGPCLDAGILDSVETAIIPVMLRKGARMVPESPQATLGGFKLDLVECRQLEPSGIVRCKYNVSRQMAASLGEAMFSC
ncbi:riboflavin biosynthesis protein RibD domain-containing protein [Colletotrichum higginsianum]|uniref:2,5-diamino-6-ribosylamino-4(3H)-pyrimidinone 5'-phosphate reductase n=2 Tax=Colletotrichum higginsianum TaxID=80884 RepID=H1VMF0_COLHI|nr:Riboflavin biosynthesis protein RibD domain-containing protein [Colletotrichum higginsianum IMI 349063]OBR14451.1 Riboflavin biosynthesis protein RibD domain-containing protein [Colletotrichum higginsianum IMI 349063]TID01799.1 Uncharacterized protein CH35J_004562 [Colletotrichum higginsianum]GJC94887.1 riboflavin biosynthesis protein RibD domain-containing protein [Colletotrichum higginsianum]CCF41404.1 riboflavin biosynthesis protein RibD domain-containing protein [Colletotrichum higginsia